MLDKLEKILKDDLLGLLEDRSKWSSLIVNRRKPFTYRVFTTLSGLRICLHKFDPCHLHEAFLHPHPWAGAFAILKGSYRMEIGYSLDRFQKPIMLLPLICPAGFKYEITNPMIWHSVTPLETTYTVMVNGEAWSEDVAHTEIRRTKGKDLEMMPENELLEHLNIFKRLVNG